MSFRQQLKGRFAALGLIVLGVLAVLLVRLWTMQVLAGETYAAQAEDNRLREIPIDAPRGRILDRDGRELVTNRVALAVTVEPQAKDRKGLVDDLSALLDVPAADIEERLTSVREAAFKPRIVALDVPMSKVAYLAEHSESFPGVQVDVVAVRDYPNGRLGAHVVGYTGEISEGELKQAELTGYRLGDVVGKTGAEREFERVLQGDKGYRRIEVDARGRPKDVVEEIEPVAGRDVRLTIDLKVQAVAEKALADAIDEAHRQDFRKARAGAAVALDVRTGEVLAMASAPTYDPKMFLGGISSKEWKRLTAKGSEYPLNNRAIMAAYPPASTFKLVTGAAALKAGITSEWKTYHCEGKWEGMGEQWSKYCWNRSGHGTVSFRDGIEESCDTVFYEIGYEFYKRDKEEIQAMARRFGFGSPTGVDLPGEVSGRVPDAKWKREYNEDYPEWAMWLPGDTVNLAIGQGDSLATPLQIATAYAAIANGGKVLEPRVLDAVLDAEGKPTLESRRQVVRGLKLSKGRIGVLRRGLEDVTTSGTAAGVFDGFGASTAGKTGTAQVSRKDDYAWFVGYAPAEKPRYVVAVVVEQGGHGGSVAGPAARSILGELLGLSTEQVHTTDASR